MGTHRIGRRCAVLVIVALGAWPSSVPAQEPGVSIDPSSAPGKEYAFPLDEARSSFGGARRGTRGSSSAPAASSAPATATASPSSGGTALFGAGISRASGQPPRADGSRPASREQAARANPEAVGTAAASERSSSTGVTLAVVLGVLALGVLAGVGARRLRSR